ncbi:hypothetical protein SAY87_027179 [Trapa incisa]|uniref:Longin domain-containing protein n=1 Tax=Trapa incisa TaxID=236973 RepID=A0AAN7H0J5_9MYRT|nr:hypothetical protein SAY87_027179 [Trapa incisa]
MRLLSNSNLVLYACIAKGTSILAEFSRDHTDIPPLALKCIELAPLHHSMFSQTHRGRTYTFLIDDPFVYFGIFNEALSKSEGLHFLGEVKVGFLQLIKNGSMKISSDLEANICSQAQLDTILHGMMKKPPGTDLPNGGENLTAQVMGNPRQMLKQKKKNRFNGEVSIGRGSDAIIIKDISLENKADEVNGAVARSISYSGMDGQKARQVWKKQVWVILFLDLFMCAILFGVWFWVCRGLQCIVYG